MLNKELVKYSENKIFITGLTGSGKTTFAKEYSKKFNVKYVDFDENWGYNKSPIEEYSKIVSIYPIEFVTDAIPYPIIDDKFLFLDYYNLYKNDIKIICLCCTDKNELYYRISLKKYKPNNILDEFNSFYFHTIKTLFSIFDMIYYDTYQNEFINKDELYKRITWGIKE